MNANDYVLEAISGFQEARQLTYDLLSLLSDRELAESLPRPDLDTFGKHFQEMGDTQESYALGIHSGVMDFSTIRTYIVPELVSSRKRLRSFLEGHDARLQEILTTTEPDALIAWPEGERISVVEHLGRLIRHEIFHHGQLAAFVYLKNLRFPKSWVATWVLPSRPGELYPSETTASPN
jgi:hypothetical protein